MVGNFVDNNVDFLVLGNINFGGKVIEINIDDIGYFLMFFICFSVIEIRRKKCGFLKGRMICFF